MASKIMKAGDVLDRFHRALEAATYQGPEVNIDALPAVLSGDVTALGRDGAIQGLKFLDGARMRLGWNLGQLEGSDDIVVLDVIELIHGALLEHGVSTIGSLLKRDPDELGADDERLSPGLIKEMQRLVRASRGEEE